ncbi:MAG: SurA N-terminal domain-containing protein [Deltaproteobacteria bacterium]|nr:SurA N-terminal domain-containing protein [Deltaproteobacteria bacterium]
MLDLMRRHASSWIIKVALGGIIIVFIFFFGWGGPGNKDRDYAAKVNDRVIGYDHFYNTYQTEVEKIRLRFRGAMPTDLFERLNLKKNVLDRLVDQEIMIQEASKLGLFVNESDIRHEILYDPNFQRNGVFDPEIFRMFLSSLKLTPDTYEKALKQELLADQVSKLVTDSVKTDPEELKTLWHFQNDKMTLAILMIKSEEPKDKSLVDEKDLESYFKRNESRYQIPASAKIEYVWFSWKDLLRNISVTDEEALSYYKSNQKEFVVPEKVQIGQILLRVPEKSTDQDKEDIKQKAVQLEEKLRTGSDFHQLAKANSQDDATASKGGDLGWITRGSMNPLIEDAAFKLKKGGISSPILTEQGYHLILTQEKVDETQTPFDEAKDQIVQNLRDEQAKRKIAQFADDFYEKVYRTENLPDPAKKFGLELSLIDLVTQEGGIPGVVDDPNISKEVFELKTGEVSKLVRSGENYLVVQLLEKRPERIPFLAEVRGLVEKDYAKDQALATATKTADGLIAAITKDQSDAEKIAKRNNLEWETLDAVSRTAGFVPQLGKSNQVSEMLTSVSQASPVYQTPLITPTGVAIVRLVKTDPASDEEYAKGAAEFRNWVLEVRRTEFLKGWLRMLRDKSSVEINQKLL